MSERISSARIRNGLHASMHAGVLFGTLGFVAVCHGFAPSSFTSTLSRHSLSVSSSAHSLRAASVKFARERRCPAIIQMQGGDELAGMFSGSEQLVFDPKWSDQENLSINGAKATKAKKSILFTCIFNQFVLEPKTLVCWYRLQRAILLMQYLEATLVRESSDMGSRLSSKYMLCTLAS